MANGDLSGFNRYFLRSGGVLLRAMIGLVLLAGLRSEGTLNDLAGHWASVEISKNLTGDIDVSPTGITFQNGKTIQLEYVRDRSDLGLHIQGNPSLREFRIVNPDPLGLRQGQGLCGIPATKKATYVAAYISELSPFLSARFGLPTGAKYQGLILYTYFSTDEPKSFPDGACLGLAYFRPDPGTTQSSSALQVVGLGLSKLHWGMAPKNVETAYPALEWRLGQQAITELTANYSAFGCKFTVTATFLGEPLPMLRRVVMDTDDIGCSREVQESLLQQFGTTPQETSYLGVVSREWRLDPNYVEFVQYPDGRLGNTQRISITFADLTKAVRINQ